MCIKNVIYFSSILLLIGCRTITVNHENYKETNQAVLLASCGVDDYNFSSNTFKPFGIPNFKSPIKLQVTANLFNKSSYNNFKKSCVLQNKQINIVYNDSLNIKPRFLTLEIVDKISVIKSLNDSENEDLKTYIENEEEARIVNVISAVFTPEMNSEILLAEEVFLIHSGVKSLGIGLFKNGKLLKIINLHESVIFEYDSFGFCWKLNNKHKLIISDIVEGYSCPKGTKRDSRNVKNKKDYFNY